MLDNEAAKKRQADGQSVGAPSLHLIPVEAMEEPISGIPNLVGESGGIISVRLVNTWANCSSDYIAMCHGDLT